MLRYSCFLLLFLNLFSLPSYSAQPNTITAGTTLKVRFAEPVDSKVRNAGYRVKVTVDSEIEIDGKVVIKAGSQAQAMINKIGRSGRGKNAPEIIVSLTNISVNNRTVNISSFPIAGKGTTSERKEVGQVDDNENIVIGKQGEKITTSIPVMAKGYDITISEGTAVYFILKEPIIF